MAIVILHSFFMADGTAYLLRRLIMQQWKWAALLGSILTRLVMRRGSAYFWRLWKNVAGGSSLRLPAVPISITISKIVKAFLDVQKISFLLRQKSNIDWLPIFRQF